MKTKPELGIKNPYALDDTQFEAAVDLLKQQKPMISPVLGRLHEADGRLPQRRRDRRHDLADHHEPAPGRDAGRSPVDVIKPRGGRDRLVRHLDDQLQDEAPRTAPTCSSTTSSSPETNAQIAEYFGEAPGNSKSCAPDRSDRPGRTATIFHADDDAFWKDIWYWQTPEAECVDGRTDVKCKGFDDWIKAWTEIKG